MIDVHNNFIFMNIFSKLKLYVYPIVNILGIFTHNMPCYMEIDFNRFPA